MIKEIIVCHFSYDNEVYARTLLSECEMSFLEFLSKDEIHPQQKIDLGMQILKKLSSSDTRLMKFALEQVEKWLERKNRKIPKELLSTYSQIKKYIRTGKGEDRINYLDFLFNVKVKEDDRCVKDRIEEILSAPDLFHKLNNLIDTREAGREFLRDLVELMKEICEEAGVSFETL